MQAPDIFYLNNGWISQINAHKVMTHATLSTSEDHHEQFLLPASTRFIKDKDGIRIALIETNDNSVETKQDDRNPLYISNYACITTTSFDSIGDFKQEKSPITKTVPQGFYLPKDTCHLRDQSFLGFSCETDLQGKQIVWGTNRNANDTAPLIFSIKYQTIALLPIEFSVCLAINSALEKKEKPPKLSAVLEALRAFKGEDRTLRYPINSWLICLANGTIYEVAFNETAAKAFNDIQISCDHTITVFVKPNLDPQVESIRALIGSPKNSPTLIHSVLAALDEKNAWKEVELEASSLYRVVKHANNATLELCEEKQYTHNKNYNFQHCWSAIENVITRLRQETYVQSIPKAINKKSCYSNAHINRVEAQLKRALKTTLQTKIIANLSDIIGTGKIADNFITDNASILNHHKNPLIDYLLGIENTRSWRKTWQEIRYAARAKLLKEADDILADLNKHDINGDLQYLKSPEIWIEQLSQQSSLNALSNKLALLRKCFYKLNTAATKDLFCQHRENYKCKGAFGNTDTVKKLLKKSKDLHHAADNFLLTTIKKLHNELVKLLGNDNNINREQLIKIAKEILEIIRREVAGKNGPRGAEKDTIFEYKRPSFFKSAPSISEKIAGQLQAIETIACSC